MLNYNDFSKLKAKRKFIFNWLIFCQKEFLEGNKQIFLIVYKIKSHRFDEKERINKRF